MNFFRLFRKKTAAWAYVVARTEQEAVRAVWLHGGLGGGLDEAIEEKLVHGGEVYCVCISIQHKVNVTIVEDTLDGMDQKNT